MMMSMSMMIMLIWWWWWWWWCVSVGQEVQKKFVCWGSSQNLQFFLSFFLSLGSSSSVFDRFQVLFCGCCWWKSIFVWKPIFCFRLLLFSCELDENFGVLPVFLSFSGFGFCRSLLPWEFQSRDIVVVTFWRFEELGVVAVDYFSFCSWFVCLFVLPSIFS